ncbi:hypothetical protein AKO1_006865 [Acrasis kona]|uniref:PX domain-containing protein n=1 Tax=Acrasis kona TaxID=1008807 RepID=A0AAW2YWK5_9EUKA
MEDEILRIQERPPSMNHLKEEAPFMGFGFKKFFCDFPLIKGSMGEITSTVDETLKTLKHMNMSSREERGKKRGSDKTFRRAVRALTEFYLRILHGSSSTSSVFQLKNDMNVDQVKEMNQKVRQVEEEKVLPVIGNLINFWADIANEHDGKTVRELYQMCKSTPDLMSLPPQYVVMVNSLQIIAGYRLYEHFVLDENSKRHVNLLKNGYRFTPFFAIQGLLKVGNPVKIFKGIINLMFARVMGTQSIIQRVVSSASEQDDAEEEEEEEDHNNSKKKAVSNHRLKKMIDNKDIVAKIQNYVNKPVRDLSITSDQVARATQILSDIDIQPVIPTSTINQLTSVQIKAINTFFIRRIRARDQEQLAALLGTDSLRDTIEYVVSACYQPLLHVYQSSDLGAFCDSLSNFLKTLVDINNEASKLSEDQLLCRYGRAVGEMIENVYSMLHKILREDKDKTVENLFEWFVGNYYSQKTANIDVEQEIVKKHLTHEQQLELLAELESLEEWKRHKKSQNQLKLQLELEGRKEQELEKIVVQPEPVLNIVPLLVKPYVEVASVALPKLLNE